MARRTHNRKVDSRTARLTLKPRREPYWTRLERGLAIGYRRGAGTWIARRYDPAATPPITYESLGPADDASDNIGLSVDAAQKKAREWFEKQSAPSGARSPLTVREAFTQYVAYLKREKSPSATYNAEGSLLGKDGKRGPRKCTLAPLHDVLLIDLKKQQLEDWRDGLVTATDEEERRQEKDTCNRLLNTVKAALTRAADDEDNKYPADAPRQWERMKAFKGVARPRTLLLKADQTRRLLNAIGRGALHDLVYGGFLTGLRPGRETKLLTVGAFNADAETLTVDLGKTNHRIVYLNPEAMALFARLTAGRKDDEPLFLNDDGKPWNDAKEWNRPLKKAGARVGLPITGRGGVVAYTMRHAHISAALVAKNRMPTQVLAENCGMSQKMIEQNYGKIDSDDRRRFIKNGTAKLGLEKSAVVPLRGHR